MKITEERIVYIAQHVATWTYQHIISVTDIERPIALSAAKDSGDEFARMLVLTLKENGVEIELRVAAHAAAEPKAVQK